MFIVQAEHVKYDLLDYAANRLSIQEHDRVEEHLQNCLTCQNHYRELLSTENILKESHEHPPSPVYFTTILPRVRERLEQRRRPVRAYAEALTKVLLPLSVSAFLVLLVLRVPIDFSSESNQTDALQRVMKDLSADEMVQAVEGEYAGSSFTTYQDLSIAGVEEHLQGDRFLKAAVSKQIENEEIAEMDLEGMISDLSSDQVDQVLSKISERNAL
ncbi:MAG: hypothetical protein EHM64_12665 [Ignavibacteriae bacterium]|nr:MAG: hypothetical protein EHM64_12665 [Ignavibacteriota bacterium]